MSRCNWTSQQLADEQKAGRAVIKTQFGGGATPASVPAKAHKLHAQRATSAMLDGHSFPSRLERDVAESLFLLQKAGVISDLRFQQSVQLGADVKWKCDFSYLQDGRIIYHEAKGFEDGEYRRKRKLFIKYRSEELRISKRGKGNGHYISEIINMPDRQGGIWAK
jgi:hypothetical protein